MYIMVGIVFAMMFIAFTHDENIENNTKRVMTYDEYVKL